MRPGSDASETDGATVGDHTDAGSADVRRSQEQSGPRRLTPVEGMPMVSPALAPLGLAVDQSPVDDAIPPYVRRAMAGDTRAFAELYQLHRRDVGRLVARLLGPRGDLEDAVQEVFIQVFRSLPGFR